MSQADLIGIAGGGTFARALGHLLSSAGRNVLLWSKKSKLETSGSVSTTADARAFAERARFVVFAVPAIAAEARMLELGRELGSHHLLVHAVGALAADRRRVSEIALEVTPVKRVGVLAGPALPDDLVHGRFVSMVVASPFSEVTREAVRLLAVPPRLRLYQSRDLIGVELSSAIASAYTIALGVTHALELGSGPRAVLITRALAEANRLVQAAGGEPGTFSGLSGLGNLLVRASPDTRDTAPSFALGMKLGRGDAPPGAEDVTEGARAATAGVALAKKLQQRVPVLEAIAEILEGRLGAEEAARAVARTVALEE